MEAAFAGELDVFFSGDQPAINLIARGGRWKIVGRLFEDGGGWLRDQGTSYDESQKRTCI